MPRVVLDGVAKAFERPGEEPICALRGVSLTVEDKESLVIVGPSGSGKTTALRLIAGLEAPTSGIISIGGKVLNGVPPKERDVAMVFQTPALYPHMSVYENIAFGLRLRRCPRLELQRRVREAAERLGLTGCLTAKPMALSGGQRQRVAIGRAMVRRPSVFLFDEPLANVDPTLRTQMRNELSNLVCEFGTTMIYVTHDHAEAMMLGNRVAVLREGVLQQVADPVSLYNQPANVFVAGFIGTPPMNFICGVLSWRGGALFFEAEPGPCLRLGPEASRRMEGYVNQSVVLGIRPEHIACRTPGSDAASTQIVAGKILCIQPVGPDTFLQLSAGGHSLAARVPAGAEVGLDQTCTFYLDMRQARFFDPGTGKAISAACAS